MENKCEKQGLAHAWRSADYMYGFQVAKKETCENCGLSREHHSQTKEWVTYSDGRPSEDVTPIRPV